MTTNERENEQRALIAADRCGRSFHRLSDGEEVLCDLPIDHRTRDGKPSAHAWGTR